MLQSRFECVYSSSSCLEQHEDEEGDLEDEDGEMDEDELLCE